MCLYISQKAKIKTARRNITVYKTVRYLPENKDIVESLYYDFLYRKGEEQPWISLVIDGRAYSLIHYVSEGYHSFLTRQQALYEAERWTTLRNTRTVVIKMEIPKGAEYIQANKQIVSSTIIWRE